MITNQKKENLPHLLLKISLQLQSTCSAKRNKKKNKRKRYTPQRLINLEPTKKVKKVKITTPETEFGVELEKLSLSDTSQEEESQITLENQERYPSQIQIPAKKKSVKKRKKEKNSNKKRRSKN